MNFTILNAINAAALGMPLFACAQDLQHLRELERKLETSEAAAQTTSVIKVGPQGVSIASSDNANVVKLRGTLHFDVRRFLDEVTPDTADTFILRRVRPTLEGTLNRIYDFRFMPDFGDGRTIIVDAYATARFRPWLRLTAGKFKVPVGLERLQSSNDIRFIERGFPTSLVPNRDLGVAFDGDIVAGHLSYSIGYFNGVTDGSSSDSHAEPDVENDGEGDWAGRMFAHPFSSTNRRALRGLGVGIAATYGESIGSAMSPQLPSYRTSGQQTFFSYRVTSTSDSPAGSGAFADGKRLRITPQLYYHLGRFGVLGEYVQAEQDVSRSTTTAGRRSGRLVHRAWQLQMSWFLTGERESFRGFVPLKTFSLDEGTWGAFELAARIHQLDIDDAAFTGGIDSFADPETAASRARAYGIGVTWYLNQNFKWQLNYEVTRFDRGSPTGDRDDERALVMRLAVEF